MAAEPVGDRQACPPGGGFGDDPVPLIDLNGEVRV